VGSLEWKPLLLGLLYPNTFAYPHNFNVSIIDNASPRTLEVGENNFIHLLLKTNFIFTLGGMETQSGGNESHSNSILTVTLSPETDSRRKEFVQLFKDNFEDVNATFEKLAIVSAKLLPNQQCNEITQNLPRSKIMVTNEQVAWFHSLVFSKSGSIKKHVKRLGKFSNLMYSKKKEKYDVECLAFDVPTWIQVMSRMFFRTGYEETLKNQCTGSHGKKALAKAIADGKKSPKEPFDRNNSIGEPDSPFVPVPDNAGDVISIRPVTTTRPVTTKTKKPRYKQANERLLERIKIIKSKYTKSRQDNEELKKELRKYKNNLKLCKDKCLKLDEVIEELKECLEYEMKKVDGLQTTIEEHDPDFNKELDKGDGILREKGRVSPRLKKLLLKLIAIGVPATATPRIIAAVNNGLHDTKWTYSKRSSW